MTKVPLKIAPNHIAITVGADPEFFVTTPDGKPVSAFRTNITGTKNAPQALSGGNGRIQVDGLALEVNVDPAYHPNDFSYNLRNALAMARKMVPKDYNFTYDSTMFFTPEEFDATPSEHKELGCEPDYNAYAGGAVNPRPQPPVDPRGIMRTAGGHLHVGWGSKMDANSLEHLEDCVRVIRNLDMFFIPESLKWDKDEERRKMYGARGAFRPKTYGVEYRSLSNKWLNHPKLWDWMAISCQTVVFHTMEGIDYANHLDLKTGVVKHDELPKYRPYYAERNVPQWYLAECPKF